MHSQHNSLASPIGAKNKQIGARKQRACLTLPDLYVLKMIMIYHKE